MNSVLLKRCGDGLVRGFFFGAVFSILTVVSYFVDGPRWFERHQFTVGGLTGFYLVGGAITGALGALLAPLAHSVFTAGLAGFVAALPLFSAAWFFSQRSDFSGVAGFAEFAVLMSAVFGTFGGVDTYNRARRRRQRLDEQRSSGSLHS